MEPRPFIVLTIFEYAALDKPTVVDTRPPVDKYVFPSPFTVLTRLFAAGPIIPVVVEVSSAIEIYFDIPILAAPRPATVDWRDVVEI